MKFLRNHSVGLTDAQLVHKIVQGEQAALSIAMDRYMTPVFRLSYSLLNDISKAEDVAQDTFIVLWEKADTWSPTGKLVSWLLRIARNKSIDEMRKSKNHSDIDNFEISCEDKSAYEHVFDQELAQSVHNHMAVLPERQREAITLVHFIGCNNTEAAETLEISVDALESLLARGRKKLRALLGAQKDSLLKGENL